MTDWSKHQEDTQVGVGGIYTQVGVGDIYSGRWGGGGYILR